MKKKRRKVECKKEKGGRDEGRKVSGKEKKLKDLSRLPQQVDVWAETHRTSIFDSLTAASAPQVVCTQTALQVGSRDDSCCWISGAAPSQGGLGGYVAACRDQPSQFTRAWGLSSGTQDFWCLNRQSPKQAKTSRSLSHLKCSRVLLKIPLPSMKGLQRVFQECILTFHTLHLCLSARVP